MKRSMHVVVLAVLSVLLLGPVPNSLARPPGPRLPVDRNIALPEAIDVGSDVAAAYGTGTIVHADALRAGEHALADVDVAFSGAAFSSAPAASEYTNEVHRLVAPKLGVNAAFGRGTGLELGLASDPIPVIGQLSQASAPPSTKLIEKVIGPIGVPGVLRAELLRSQAQGRSAADACVLGPDQAYGLGSVLNLEVLGGLLSTVARPPLREVSQSNSTTRIVPGSEPGRLGLKSETRQTIAPVTFFSGSPFQFTVEVLGEWALRATADGAMGQVRYGPLNASPETPVVRILGAKGEVLGQLTTQMLLGQKGLEVTIPGVAEIVVGEDPRMIGGDASSPALASPTQAVAAADVVRVKLLTGQLADVRIGHMEAAVTVPAGGVQCPGLTVGHTVDKPAVTPGDDFVYTITVTNPDDCELQKVKLVETPTASKAGVKFEIVSTTPPGGNVSGSAATYPDIGPLGPGETKTVKIKVNVPLDSLQGKLTALAVAEGVCPPALLPPNDVDGPQPGAPGVGGIPVRGEASVNGPSIGACVVPDLKNLTLANAKAALEAAGCVLGTVTDRPGTPADVGKVVDQAPPGSTSVPLGTPVDVTVSGPAGSAAAAASAAQACVVPNLIGTSEAAARSKVETAGCVLISEQKLTTNPAEVGKVMTQSPAAAMSVAKGSQVKVTLGTQVPGQQLARAGAATGPATEVAAGPTLVRTGGVALGGLALWLLISGLLTQAAGSDRLWRLVRRSKA